MKTYKQARREYDKEIEEAQDRIKNIKATKTFDFYCPQCDQTKKMLVIRMKQGRQGLKYCHANCRQAAQRQRDKQKVVDEITNLKNRIKELEDENIQSTFSRYK